MTGLLRRAGEQAGQNVRLLVVEDDAIDARILRRFVNDGKDGVQVDLARSIGQARTMLIGRCYEAILADHHLPDGFGMDFLRDSVACGLLRHAQAYLLTSIPEHAEQSLGSGQTPLEILDKRDISEEFGRRIVARARRTVAARPFRLVTPAGPLGDPSRPPGHDKPRQNGGEAGRVRTSC